MTQRRLRVGVLAGGASAEREISLASGQQVARALQGKGYEVVLLDPVALMAHDPALAEQRKALAAELPAAFRAEVDKATAAVVPAANALVARDSAGGERIDVAFVALHGPWGEDGTIQGVLEMLGIPYTGSGVLASALAMDKVMAKTVLAAAGLDVPKGEVVTAQELAANASLALIRAGSVGMTGRSDRSVRNDLVVKPVRQGSSVGMSIVHRTDELRPALERALRFDERALVEERVPGTELTCGVLGTDAPEALPVIEIVSKREFFDYRAKYDPELSDEICPARIPDAVRDRVQAEAVTAHRALGCRGISRTDAIWTGERLVTLEVNTMPGMTPNSLVPKAARVAGIEFADLCDRLVRWALEDRR